MDSLGPVDRPPSNRLPESSGWKCRAGLGPHPMPNPPPEAGSSRRVGRDRGRLSGPAKAWTPHIPTHLPTSSVTWSKSPGLSGPQSPHGQTRITVSAQGLGQLVVNVALLPSSHITSGKPLSLSELWALPPMEKDAAYPAGWLFRALGNSKS